jgi:hypothetical protein
MAPVEPDRAVETRPSRVVTSTTPPDTVNRVAVDPELGGVCAFLMTCVPNSRDLSWYPWMMILTQITPPE